MFLKCENRCDFPCVPFYRTVPAPGAASPYTGSEDEGTRGAGPARRPGDREDTEPSPVGRRSTTLGSPTVWTG